MCYCVAHCVLTISGVHLEVSYTIVPAKRKKSTTHATKYVYVDMRFQNE